MAPPCDELCKLSRVSLPRFPFADQISGDQITFDYVMRPGVVQHGNALALMRHDAPDGSAIRYGR